MAQGTRSAAQQVSVWGLCVWAEGAAIGRAQAKRRLREHVHCIIEESAVPSHRRAVGTGRERPCEAVADLREAVADLHRPCEAAQAA